MKNEGTELDTLIVGATFTGLGIACYRRQINPNRQTLIVERGITVGHEFIYAYKHGSKWMETNIRNEATAALKKELLRRNVLSAEGRAHLPGITPVLYQMVRDQELPIQFMTEIVSVEAGKGRNGFKVTIFDGSGFRELTVGKIVDTTSDYRTHPHFQAVGKKGINALLHSKNADKRLPEGQVMSLTNRDFFLQQGRFESEAFLSLPLLENEGWVEGRRKIHEFWVNRPMELQGWSLASVADQLDHDSVQGPHEIEPHWHLLTSSAYANPFASMEEGMEWAKGRVYA